MPKTCFYRKKKNLKPPVAPCAKDRAKALITVSLQKCKNGMFSVLYLLKIIL
jgi:hypothetical protein